MTEPTAGRITRHKLADRFFHWVMAVCTLILLGTGFLPVLDVHFDWVTIHWIAGLVLTGAVAFHIVRVISLQRLVVMWSGPAEIAAAVRNGLRRLRGRGGTGYRPGKYSVSQMLFHAGAAVFILATIVTGLVMLKGIDTPVWERDTFFVSESTRGIIFVIHGLAALFLVTMIMLHIYFAFRPEKSYFTRSMVLGWITREEYIRNHDIDKWLEDQD